MRLRRLRRRAMKGLDAARQFFFAAGVPLLASLPSEVLATAAVGLVGEGSECFGIDDEVSRDHDWGAGFCVWLPQDVCARYGEILAQGLRGLCPPDGLTSRFANLQQLNDGRVGVFAIPDFYRRFIGFGHPPHTLREWWAIPDANLATVANGAVFCDRAGEFSRWRKVLTAGYPRDIRLKKMAYCCYIAMQAGQYNAPRMAIRGQAAAAGLCEAVFTVAALRLTYYLNNRYPPFYKWLQPLVQPLPVMGRRSFAFAERLAVLPSAARGPEELTAKQAVIEEWSWALEQALAEQGFIPQAGEGLYAAAQRMHGAIEEPWLRQIPLEVRC